MAIVEKDFIKVNSTEEGIRRAEEMVEFGGMGHSAVIHSSDDQMIEEFGKRVKTDASS